MSTRSHADATVEIQPGDDLVLITDGITEARDAAGGFFDEERVDEILAAAGESAEIVDALSSAVVEFSAGRSDQDDMTVLGLSFY